MSREVEPEPSETNNGLAPQHCTVNHLVSQATWLLFYTQKNFNSGNLFINQLIMFNVSIHFFSANNVIIYKEICLECLPDDIKILQQLHIS